MIMFCHLVTGRRRVIGVPRLLKTCCRDPSGRAPATPHHCRPRPQQVAGTPTTGRRGAHVGCPGAESTAQAKRASLVPGPTLPEAEIAPGAARVTITATAMPKGPKQQPPEPEWIGDGETTSPTGKAGRQRRKKVEKRRERNVRRVLGEGGGRDSHWAFGGLLRMRAVGPGRVCPG